MLFPDLVFFLKPNEALKKTDVTDADRCAAITFNKKKKVTLIQPKFGVSRFFFSKNTRRNGPVKFQPAKKKSCFQCCAIARLLAISSEPLNSIVAGPSLMNNNQAAPAAHCHDNKEISTSKLEINWGILTQAIKDSRRASATEATPPFQFSFVVQALSPGKRNSIKKKHSHFLPFFQRNRNAAR